MTERRATRRYDLSLPIIISFSKDGGSLSHKGKTRDISTRGVYFTIGQEFIPGAELEITLTLPVEITRGTEVFVRAQARVVRVEQKSDDDRVRMGVAAVIERYDIIRGEGART